MRFVLVHSPVVGPTTWRWVAEALDSLGHEACVPDLRAAAQGGDPHAFVRAADSALCDADVVVGHSGAGGFIPSIATPLPPHARLVFVDAGVPPCRGDAAPGGDFLAQLRGLAIMGVLPRWSRWWGEDAMRGLVGDEERRELIEAELPEVPIAFFDTPVVLPDKWCGRPSAFVLLSDAYRDDASTARSRGWPVVERLGAHLDIVNHPDPIARTLIELSC